jgi:DUF2946 family protein
VPRANDVNRRLRPWLAMMVAYALALQLILSGAVLQGVHAADASFAGPVPTCLEHGAADNGDDSGTPAGKHQHCVLCVVAGGPLTVLPAERAVVVFAAAQPADIAPARDDRIACYHSPTGQFQRGPPAHRQFAG